MISRSVALALIGVGLLASACSKHSEMLPGSSVSPSGAIALSPPTMSQAPRISETSELTREPLGIIEQRLFAPELLMDHQQALQMPQSQRDALLLEMQRGQTEMVKLQWDLQSEKEKLAQVLNHDHVDEKASSEAANQLMLRENRVKAAHLAMLVRLKNSLTPAQQAQLRSLRGASETAPAQAGKLGQPTNERDQ